MDNAIHWISHLLAFVLLICWIVIYPVDGAVQRLNNRGLVPFLESLGNPSDRSLNQIVKSGLYLTHGDEAALGRPHGVGWENNEQS